MQAVRSKRTYFYSVLFCVAFLSFPAFSEDLKVMKFVTAARDGSSLANLSRLTLTEAFKRLGYDFQLQSYPQKRCIALMKSGEVDGDATRVFSFNKNNKHPYYIRVDENHARINFSVFMVKPTIKVSSWHDLKKANYRIGYLAGVKYSEQNLVDIIAPHNLIPQSNSNLSGLLQLASGRIDAYVYADGVRAKQDLAREELKNSNIDLAGVVDYRRIYPYLQAKHKDLAEDLAEQIKLLKSEGLLEQFQRQALAASSS